MTATRKVYLSKDTLTIATGGTLVLNGTLSGTIGCAAPATLAVATDGMTVDASGNTAIKGTLGVTGLTTLNGGATNPALKLSGAGSLDAHPTVGTLWTTGAPVLATNQAALRIYVGSTVYRIPIWADA